jgi:hypothetical protein
MSPPPIEATRCQPNSSATAVTAMIDHRADRADEDADEHLGVVDLQQGPVEAAQALALDLDVGGPADQDRGQADKRVQQRDQLGHAGHLHDPGPPEADRAADDDRDDQDQRGGAPGGAVVHGQADGGGEGDDHARHAVDPALAGGLVLAQAGQRQDEQQGGDQVGGGSDGGGGHVTSPC